MSDTLTDLITSHIPDSLYFTPSPTPTPTPTEYQRGYTLQGLQHIDTICNNENMTYVFRPKDYHPRMEISI